MDMKPKTHVDLVLEGVDTYAEIYFNGQLIGETEITFGPIGSM